MLCGKWTLSLLASLADGPRRFCELERRCAGISPRTLRQRLDELRANGLVEKNRATGRGCGRCHYELTASGAAVRPLLVELERFAETWLLPGAVPRGTGVMGSR